jgi:hypothetical protein
LKQQLKIKLDDAYKDWEEPLAKLRSYVLTAFKLKLSVNVEHTLKYIKDAANFTALQAIGFDAASIDTIVEAAEVLTPKEGKLKR